MTDQPKADIMGPDSGDLFNAIMNLDDPWWPASEEGASDKYTVVTHEEANEVVRVLSAYQDGRLLDLAKSPAFEAMARMADRLEAQAGDPEVARDIKAIRELADTAKIGVMPSLQKRIAQWITACLGEECWDDMDDRTIRFLEEAVELAQALGIPEAAAHRVVSYVYDREIGEPPQEIAGVFLTLANVATCHNFDMTELAEKELARVWGKIDKVRAKQAGKPDLLKGEPVDPDMLSDAQRAALGDAVFRIDHSCGLMTPEDYARMEDAGREWLQALVQSGLVEMTGTTMQGSAAYKAGLQAAADIIGTHLTIPGNAHLEASLRAARGSILSLKSSSSPAPAATPEGFVADATSELYAGPRRAAFDPVHSQQPAPAETDANIDRMLKEHGFDQDQQG
jgi:hypothetical protein